MPLTPVRLADAADLGAVSGVLAAAFEGYVWTDWAFPAADRAARVRASFGLYAGAAMHGSGEVWISEDGSAAAIWNAPGDVDGRDAAAEQLGPAARRLLGDRADLVHAAEAAVAASRPVGPHWYLGAVGTRPAARGRGLARAILAPVLHRCDEIGSPAVLDTSTTGNVRLYESLAFRVVAELDPPGGAPHVWVMQRLPTGKGGRATR